MSRITAPVAKLSQAASLSYAARATPAAHAAAATTSLSQKYADLLRSREHHEACLSPPLPLDLPLAHASKPGHPQPPLLTASQSRNITTTHRPTPQPSLANRTRPLMQSFSSSASLSSPSSATHLDTTTLPTLTSYAQTSASDLPHRIPLLPDAYQTAHAPASAFAADVAARAAPDIPAPARTTIVAADPTIVVSGSGMADVAGVEGVRLGFAHEAHPEGDARETAAGMIRDVWKGIVDDVVGEPKVVKA